MADKSIVELDVAQQMTDDALLPVYQGGETKAIEGALIKRYARESTKQYVEGAAQSAQDAAQSAEAAKTAREGVEAYAEQAGQSATQAAGSAKTAQDAVTSAEASRTAAAGSATAAQKSAGEAKASETAAGLSETNAGKSATAAQAAKTASEAAQKAAESAKTAAESSATLAGDKATEASQKATEAGGSATAAAGSATAAEKSKTDAEAAKAAAQTAQSAAEKAKTASEAAQTAAQTAQGKAEDARDTAGVSAASAANAATAANSSATAAAGSASSASAKAGEAAASAGAAKTSETNAKKSETAAGESADAAEQARQAIEALGVQGVTLAPGSQVAVEKVVAADGTVTLKFSIPQGAKGDKGNKGDQGVSISSIQRTAGTGAAGTTDTYTITLSDGSSSTFAVYNGRDGEGAGDMLANVYDPQNKAQDVFAYTDTSIADLPVKRLVGTADAPIDIDTLTEPGRYYLAGETVSSTATEDIWDTLAMYLAAGTPIDVIAVEEASMVRQTIPLCDGEPGSAASRLLEGGAFGAFDVYCAARDGHTHTAKQVAFADGETFQQKLDAGELTGADGVAGKSAYQQAIDAGYTGTEAAFYAALVSMKDAPFLPTKGGTMTGALTFGSGTSVYASAVYASGELLRFDSDSVSVMELADGQVTLLDGNTTISGVCSPSLPNDAANKEYVDGKTLVFTGKTVATTAWVSDTTYSAQGYGFRASIACTGVTTSHRPDVAFSTADAVGGNFAPVADSYAGGVYIYCKTKPTATVTIPSIVCIKGA